MSELFERERARRMNESREKGLARLSDLMKQHAQISKPSTRDNEIEDDSPKCKTCSDRGWLSIRHGDHVRHIHCPDECAAVARNRAQQQKALHEYMMTLTNRKTPPLQVTLDDYIPLNEHQAFAREAALAFCTESPGFQNDGLFKTSLVLVGEYGSGKTHLASAMYHSLSNAWYMKFGEMIRHVNDCYDPSSSVTPLQAIRGLQNIPILILDDVGRDNVTGSTKDLFFDIIDARYDMNLSTILTTNVNQRQMDTMFSPRLGDRLRHMAHWVRLDGNVRDQTGEL